MKNKFYIDESGNTGDLVVSEKNSNFSNQEYFTLACVSLQDSRIKHLEEFVENLKLKYKIQAKELKFSKIKSLFGKNIDFVFELLNEIQKKSYKKSYFIIEIVDKKYIICANIVNCLITPPYFQKDLEQEEMDFVHKYLPQWLYDNITLQFLIKFTNIARNPSEIGLKELFDELLILAKNVRDPLSEFIVESITDTMDIFEKFKKCENLDREAYTYFLPLPDISKKGQLIGILPYISSFCNIHARLNHLFHRNLSKVEFIHDNQSYFDDIIKYYHDSAVNNTMDKRKFGFSDFVFTNISSLKFQDDKALIGLQIADIVAGFINKAIPVLLERKDAALDEKKYNTMIRIITLLYSKHSINFVLPPKHNEYLFNYFNFI